MHSALRFALSLAIAGPSLHAQSPQVAGEYVVRFETAPALRALVTAHFSEPAASLRMGTGAIDHLPDMWGTFVRDLTAFDASGQPVLISVGRDTLLGKTWEAANGGAISSVKYSVDLKFTQERWPPGNEQAGLWADSALFLTTRALFVAPQRDGAWRVSFDLPPAWQLAEPWSAASNGRTAVAPTLSSLFGNTIVVGKYAAYHFNSGNSDITLALLGSNATGTRVLRETFEPVLAEYMRIFRGTPSTRYLMTIFTGDEEDGEGYESSSAFRTNVPITRAMRKVWGNTLAH
jgi:predicted metalloprotease with PDZ domain